MLSLTPWQRGAAIAALGVALFFLYFFGLTRTGLLSADEPRYAAIGQAMAQTGDWITPRLWGEPWFEKSPLLYWMTATGFKLGLDRDLAPRLPVALAATAFLIYFFVELRRQFGDGAAFYSSAILATSAGWLAYSHVAVTDLPMSAAFASAMLLAMWRVETPGRLLAAGALIGVAVLAKGLTPLLLFIPALWFLRRQFRGVAGLAAAAILIAAPWYALVTLRNGWPFFQEFIWKHHVLRFFTSELRHEQPPWYYVPVLAAGLFPWTPLVLLCFSGRLYQDRRVRFLIAWIGWGLLVFSLSRNKLPGYLLPMLPAAAALMGIALAGIRNRSVKTVASVAACAALLWFIPAIQDLLPQALLTGVTRSRIQLPTAWILPAAAATLVVALLEWRARTPWAISLVALLTTLSAAWLIVQVYPVLDRTVSARSLWTSQKESITCVLNLNRSWRYGLQYYAGRALPDCQ